MPTPISITMAGTELKAELNDSPTAQEILQRLPMEISFSRWGDEYYGSCGIRGAADETAREVMEVGELAFWPPGSAFCIFFGPTPASSDDRPRAASAANPIGRLLDDIGPLKTLGGSVEGTISR